MPPPRHVRTAGRQPRLVLKIGSSLLVDKATGKLNRAWLESIADELARLQQRGQQVLVVSSGAIALGRPYLGLARDQRRLEDAQAAAAAGQILLAHAYQDLLEARGIRIAQVLLTLDDTESRRRYLNARGTLETLLRLNVIPVINENDTVATQEIRYGDNDRLGARVAEMTSSDVLVLLSDVDGLYDGDPTLNPSARLIPEVRELTPEIEALAGASATEFGSGGMITKLVAARICMNAGCATVIASGKRLYPLKAIEEGANCTWFLPGRTPRQARKQWIAGTLVPARHGDGGRGRRAGPARRLEPAAGGHRGDRRRVPARRRGDDPQPERPGPGPRPRGLLQRGGPAHPGPAQRGACRRCSVTVAGTN